MDFNIYPLNVLIPPKYHHKFLKVCVYVRSCSNKPTQVCAHVLVEWGREIYITCWTGFYADILTLDNPRTEEAPQRRLGKSKQNVN